MATYRQEISWQEDGHGQIRAVLHISDTYNGLFVAKNQTVSTDIFSISKVTRKIASKSGGVVESNLEMEVTQASVLSVDDELAFQFILQVRNPQNKRYCALFIDPAEPVTIASAQLVGMVQTDIQADDYLWQRAADYDTNITQFSTLKFRASPYALSAFLQIGMNDLIESNKTKKIPGFWRKIDGTEDLTWQNANVADRQGYFKYTAKDRTVQVDKLVNFSKTMRKLGDNLAVALTNMETGVEFEVKFSRSKIPGKWFPARWNFAKKTRFLQPPKGAMISGIAGEPPFFRTGVPSFTVADNDCTELYIDPDGSPSDQESIWHSYRQLRGFDDEINMQESVDYRFSKIKSFFDFLQKIAVQFGMIVEVVMGSKSLIQISFKSRDEFKKNKIFFRDAAKSDIKYSTVDPNDTSKKYAGYAFYRAMEGEDIYRLDKRNGDSTITVTTGERLIFTLSPTICRNHNGGTPQTDDGYDLYYLNSYFPHNHVMVDGTIRKSQQWAHSQGLHTAVYLCVPALSSHDNELPDPDFHWTPAARLSVKVGDEQKEYSTLADYINELEGLDGRSTILERGLDCPYFYGFISDQNSPDPSWQHLDVGKMLTMNGVDYIVTEATWDYKTKTTSLKLSGTARFDITNDVTGLVTAQEAGHTTVDIEPDADTGIYDVAEDIPAACMAVSVTGAGTVIPAKPTFGHYGRVVGISMGAASAGGKIHVKKSGKMTIPEDWGDLIVGRKLYLRYPDSTATPNINISQTPLIGIIGNEALYCPIGVAVSARVFEILDGFPYNFIFTIYAEG